MKIHPIETGKVKITRSWQVGQGDGIRRLVNTLFDSKFTEWLPIYVWLIEHPEGFILIDTGISANANDRIWFPPFMPLIQRAAKFSITPEQEIDQQLQKLGFSANDVRWVLLTHLHQDHDGGLHHFPQAQFLVSEQEWTAAYGFKGRLNGYLNHRWPSWFRPQLIHFEERPFGPFSSHYSVTEADDVYLVPTPGHSPGHLSVIVREGDRSFFFAGDTSYTEDLLIAGKVDGIGADPRAQQETHQRILAYAGERPTIYLPSHDPHSKARLDGRTPIHAQSKLVVL
jgi:glyoxylase-like metal-dependent hydrolase (beta-lactamase superfamily II)